MTAAETAAEEIARNVDYLERRLAAAEDRADKAGARGAELAAIVCRYMEHSEELGRYALKNAYDRFMAAHSGNFGPGC